MGLKTKSRFLLLFAAVLAFARFIHLGNAPFILDEPHFQLLIDQHLQSRTFPSVALQGMKNIAYGPTVLWFYFPLRLFSANITALLALNAVFSALGLVALYFAVRKTAGKRAAAWTLALAASSPYLFMYSRLAWDQPLLVPLIGALAWVIAALGAPPGAALGERPRDAWLWGALGLLSGLCFNLHLSTLPVLCGAGIACLAILAASRPARPRAPLLRTLGTGLAAFVITVAPYLLKFSSGHGNFRVGFRIEDALRSLYYSSRFFSWKGMTYFFNSPAVSSSAFRPIFRIDWSYVLRVGGLLGIGLWVRKAWRQRSLAKIPPLLVFGIVSWLALLLFYAAAQPDLKQPHYFLPVWWVLFFFAAWMITRSRGKLQRLFEACAWLTLGLNAAFILISWSWLGSNLGARSLNYGPSETEITRAVRDLCGEARQLGRSHAIVGLSGVNLFPESLEFISTHAPECSGMALVFSRTAANPDFRIEYAQAAGTSAALAVR